MRELRGAALKAMAGWLSLVLLMAPVAVLFGLATGVWWPFLAYGALVVTVGLWSVLWLLWETRHFIRAQLAARRRRDELIRSEMSR